MNILEETKYVVENSDYVKINHKKIEEFSKSFDPDKADHWLNQAPFNFVHFSEEDKLHFLIIFNALSFSYWGDVKWTVEYDDKKEDGAWGMILALGRAIEEGKRVTDFEYCSNISEEEFKHILRGNIEIPLLKERYEILQEIGTNMVKRFNGKARNLIKEADGDALKLLELIINNFPSFSDTSEYKNKKIHFCKRAQLLVADIHQIFNGVSFGKLDNMDKITACADYKLPLILNNLGILEYTPELSQKINNKVEIQKYSAEETELRASVIWAVEFIKEEVKKRNPQIMSFQINDDLWLATQGNKILNPYHRTRTIAY
jgi:hypothetical protein